MKVWIDLSNSPHSLLFAPISRRLEELGHTVVVTARDNAQTAELARQHWPDVEIIGVESPKGRFGKTRTLALRIERLRRFARRERPDVAVSHNSYAQIVAAKLAAVRAVTAMDYEFQPANHLAFRVAHRVLLPEALRGSGVERQGARPSKTCYYSGLKEEIYLGDFKPDPSIRMAVGMYEDDGRALVVLRTPPSRALYHRFRNELFETVLTTFGRRTNVVCVVLTRHAEQRTAVEALDLPSCVVPAHAVDARSLMYEADLVVGAGGTMTREAALLGTPTVSVFAGRVPAVDADLIRHGLLSRVVSAEECPMPRVGDTSRRPLEGLSQRGEELVSWFVAACLSE